LHGRRWHDVLQLHRDYADAVVILVHRFLDLVARVARDIDAGYRQDLAAYPVTDDAPHHRLRDVSQGLRRVPHAVQELDRVLDPVLHDPLDLNDVQVPGQHQRLVRERAGELRPVERGGFGRAEAELLLQHALGRDVLHGIDTEG